jgi:cation-transporting ATPase 13A3/4/5
MSIYLDFYACSMFDSKAVDMSKWWLLSDNYEGEVLAMVCLFLFINNAAVFNFGYKFRQSFWRNYSLVFLWVLYLIFASYWLLADPNLFGCAFRFNCGTKEVLEQFGYAAPSVSITPYNIPLGHNVLPWEFRWKLWGLIIGMLSVELMYERLIVLGPIRAYLARKFPVKRLKIEN